MAGALSGPVVNKSLEADKHSLLSLPSDGPTQNTGEAEVAELDDSGFGEEDVLWLYIPVDALQHKGSASGILAM